MSENLLSFIDLSRSEKAGSLYRVVYDSIRDAILGGRLKSGSRLPSSRQLAADLGISRMTVMSAYDQLFAEGYLEGRRGSGTFVASSLPEEYLKVRADERKQPNSPVERKIELSPYGRQILANAATIADHHSPAMMVPFQHSLTAMREFPFDLWAKLVQKPLRYPAIDHGGYGEATGYRPLREAVSAHLRASRGVECTYEQVIITSGTQQAIDLISRVLISPGDGVLLEDPCHLGARDVFDLCGASVTDVPIDEGGIDLDHAIRRSPNARLAYVTPSRQFPLGTTMSLERRLNLLEWANDNAGWVVEDDYDSEFRYNGRPLPALQGLDRGGRVLYIGTFSKTVFPALRIGCLVLPPDLVDIFTAARALNDLHGAIADQMALAAFISEGHFERHVRRMRTLYRERQEILVHETNRHLSGRLEVAPADAGMHLIGWLQAGENDREVSQRARDAGVLAAPLSRYTRKDPEKGGLLLGYTAFNGKEIGEAVKILATLI